MDRELRTLVIYGKGSIMTPAQAKDFGSRLIQLLTQQQLLYRQLQQLAQKQRSLVDGSDPEVLLKVLAGRQRLIDRLTEVDCELQPLRADWRRMAKTLPAEQRGEAQKLVEGVKEILADILTRDEEDTEALAGRRNEVAGQIATATQGKRMNRAYAQAAAAPASRYFDSGAQ